MASGSLAPGGAPAGAASNSITLADALQLALTVTSYFETSKPMNYQGVVGDFDGQGVSFGIIQWNFGRGTLGPLLKQMLQTDEAAFAACFGPSTDYDTLKNGILSGNVAGQMIWARSQQSANPAWKAPFVALGLIDEFNQIQRQYATSDYPALAVLVIANLRAINSTLMANVEARSYAAIFDLCVQQGGIHVAMNAIRASAAKTPPATQLDLMKIAVQQRALAALPASIADCMSRRMGILTGKVYPYPDANGKSVIRDNPPGFKLIADMGTKIVAGL
jgi:hypothetical protein